MVSLAGLCVLIGPRAARTTPAVACLLMTATAIAVLPVSDAVEFSWRYQLPALVLLPPSGVLGSAAIAARIRFELTEW